MKKRILILSLLLFILSIGCVSASDDLNATDTLALEDNQDMIVSDTFTGNFKDLQNIIDDAEEGGVIKLDKDYMGSGQIFIEKQLFIDGLGHRIDANGESGIFLITCSNVTLYDISFFNGNAGDYEGGAIYSTSPLSIINCDFEFNAATLGGAVFGEDYIYIENSTFNMNHASICGGAAVATELDIAESIFYNNTANGYGGSVYAQNLTVKDSAFYTYDVMEAIGFYNVESMGYGLFLENNSMYGVNSYDIWYESYDPITSPVNLKFNDWTVKKGSEIEIATFEDDMGNIILADKLIEVEITDKNGKVADKFYLEFSDGYKYTCNLNAGVYTVNANVASSFATNAKVKKGTLNVSSSSSDNIELKASDVCKYYMGDGKYAVTAYNNGIPISQASIKISINGVEYMRTTDEKGVAILSLDYPSGTYSVTSSYKGKQVKSKVTIKATITGNDVAGTTQSTKYSVKVLNSNGIPLKNTKVTFKIGADKYSQTTDNNGVATLNLKLNEGTYHIEAANPKTSEKITNTITVNNSQSNVKIEAKDFAKYYGGSERFSVKITDNNGKALANKDVKITINGQTYTKTTDAKGIASMNIGLNSKVYPVTVECDGEKVNVKVTVKPTISGKDITKMYKNSTQYYATFVDSKGNLLKNTEVEFNINGIFYKRNTNEKGVARMNINLIPESYVITAKNPKTNEMFTNKITVKSTIVENHDLTKYYKNASRYTLRLLGSDGKPVGAGVSVELNINGVIYTKQSDAEGYVGMNINLPPGTYIVTASYNGLKASNTIKVLNILSGKDIDMEYWDGTQYEVKLLDGQGKPYAGQKVKLNINGVFYHKQTDSNGIARLTINLPQGRYTITASYNGLNAANEVVVRAPEYILHKSYGFTVEVLKGCKCNDSLSDTGEVECTIDYPNGKFAWLSRENADYDQILNFSFDNGFQLVEYFNDWTIVSNPEYDMSLYVLIRGSNPAYLIESDDLSISKQLAGSLKIVPDCVPDDNPDELIKWDCRDFSVSLPKSASIELTEETENGRTYTVEHSGNSYQITEDESNNYGLDSFMNMIIDDGGSSMGSYNGWKLATLDDNYFALKDHNQIFFSVMGPQLDSVKKIIDNMQFK